MHYATKHQASQVVLRMLLDAHPEAAKDALHDVPNLPEHYESRPELEAAHRNALLRTTNTNTITGPAGAGKSTTAVVLARDPRVHDHFPDGITWLKFGRERTGAEMLRTLASILRLDSALPQPCRVPPPRLATTAVMLRCYRHD